MGMLDFRMQTDLSLDELHLCAGWYCFDIDLYTLKFTILTAYNRPVGLCSARLTTPNEPLPSFLSVSLNYRNDLKSPFVTIYI